MSGRFRFSVVVFAVTLLAGLPAAGQDTQTTPPGLERADPRVLDFSALRVVKGYPQSADFSGEQTVTRADGTRVTRRFRGRSYRDSEGRIRLETYPSDDPADDGLDGQQHIHIFDPVAGVSYEIDPATHTALEFRFPPPATAAASAPARLRDKPKPKEEYIGERVIGGVKAEGTRVITTVASGVRRNSQPYNSVSEFWYSPEEHSVVLLASKDSHFERTERVTKIFREEPSPSLFRVPPDYSISEKPPAHAKAPSSE